MGDPHLSQKKRLTVLPLLSQNVAGWVWAVQVLGVANAELLIGLYWLQQGQGETTAAN